MTSDGGGPTIAAVETTVVTAHAKPGLRVRGARVVHDASSFVLVRVVTDEGVEGFGEISATAAWSGEDHVTATHFVRDVFAPRLIGAPLAPVERHGVELDRVVRGNWFTKAGVDTALWDALGHTLGQPVAALLGGPVPARGADQDLAQRRRRRPARRLRDRGRRSASGRSRSRSGAIPTPTSRASGCARELVGDAGAARSRRERRLVARGGARDRAAPRRARARLRRATRRGRRPRGHAPGARAGHPGRRRRIGLLRRRCGTRRPLRSRRHREHLRRQELGPRSGPSPPRASPRASGPAS